MSQRSRDCFSIEDICNKKAIVLRMKGFVFDVFVCLLHLTHFFFNEAIQNHLNATWLVNTSAGMETDMRN